jgi:hypothetical protein
LGYNLGELFTNSLGHPGQESTKQQLNADNLNVLYKYLLYLGTHIQCCTQHSSYIVRSTLGSTYKSRQKYRGLYKKWHPPLLSNFLLSNVVWSNIVWSNIVWSNIVWSNVVWSNINLSNIVLSNIVLSNNVLV